MCVSGHSFRPCWQYPPKVSINEWINKDLTKSNHAWRSKQNKVMILLVCAFLVKNLVLLVLCDANCVLTLQHNSSLSGLRLMARCCAVNMLLATYSSSMAPVFVFCCFTWSVIISCHTIFMLSVYDCTYLHGWFSFTCDRLWKTWNKQ